MILLIKVVLSPFDRYNLFYPVNLHLSFLIIGFKIALALEAKTKGRPKYFNKREKIPYNPEDEPIV